MMNAWRPYPTKWFFVILFTAYVSGISLFTHTHVINNITYIHSHPYKKSEPKQHTHTEKQLVFLDYIFHTSVTDDAVSAIDLADKSAGTETRFPLLRAAAHILKPHSRKQLRAPPEAA